MCKVSVVIPTHNRCDLLYRAVKSVQNQTFSVDEIIIVSDGSTDETEKVVIELKEKDKRIRLISYYPARNGNYARNRGISIAKGEYIAFLDDDDEWLPDKIEKQMAVFYENSECGLVYSGQNCIFTDLEFSYITKPCWKGNLSQRIFMHNDIGTPSQVVVKASVLKKTGMFDLELNALQDYDLWIRCCQETQIGFVKEPCINYFNANSTNQVSSNTEKYIKAERYIAKKYAPIVKKFSDDIQKKIYAGVESRIAQRCLRNGDRIGTRRYAISSIKIKISIHAIGLYIASFFSYKTVLMIRSRFNY